MNSWSHHFSQNTNKKLSGFLPSLHRAEILTIFCSYFERNDDFKSVSKSIIEKTLQCVHVFPAINAPLFCYCFIRDFHFFVFCFVELGKDERFRGKFKKKEGNKTGLSIKKVPQRLKVAGDDPDAKMTGYLHKVSKLKEFQALNNVWKVQILELWGLDFFGGQEGEVKFPW